MQEPLVVLTYPGHFMLTALTIQSYLKHHNPQDIFVVVDDNSGYAWPEYVDDCKNFYKQKIITASSLSFLKKESSGWIRQQLLKLYLDQLTSLSACFFTDGDIVFRYSMPANTVPFSIVRGEHVREKQNNFVKNMLGLSTVGIYAQHSDIDWTPTNTAQVCVSNPPFRPMVAQDLVALRAYVETLHNKSFQQVWTECTRRLDCSVSEWELLENFKTYVQQQPSKLIYYPTCPKDHVKTKDSDPDFCEHHFMSDSEFGRSELAKHNIQVPDQIWQHLEKIFKVI
jgi:hypothetical protein